MSTNLTFLINPQTTLRLPKWQCIRLWTIKVKQEFNEHLQPWIFTGRTDAEAESLILWPPNVKRWLTGKDPDAGKDWRQEKRETRGRDGWMDRQLKGRVFEQAPGDGEGQGSLACCSLWGRKELDTTELSWTQLGVKNRPQKSEKSNANKMIPVLKGKKHTKCYIIVANKVQCKYSRQRGGKIHL